MMDGSTQLLATEGAEELLKSPTVHESRLFALEGNDARCLTCERRCSIPPREAGFCKTRMNLKGKIYTLVYGDIPSISINPIEKKPFFHFWPGSRALTIGTWGCNFPCAWCQNHELSRTPPDPKNATYTSPEKLMQISSKSTCHGTSVSFNEPTMLFEYALDLFPIAKRLGLYNTYVSNGYMTIKVLRMLKEAGLNAIKFDIKGDAEAVRRHCKADVNLVWRNVNEARRLGMHVEVVALLIPGVNSETDSVREIIQNHLRYAGADTPLHFTRFHPNHQMTDRDLTRIETLEQAHATARKEGVNYVYLGNCPGHHYENTYCPNCGELLIERYIFDVVDYGMRRDRLCPACGHNIPIVGRIKMSVGS